MGLFSKEFSNVVEWDEFREDMIFYKWHNNEIKRGSKLIIRPGQDAVFMFNGKIEGIFKDEGNYDIESDIVPFLSTLKGFKFGFNSGMRAEVLFINTKEFTVKWGTKSAINIPTPQLPGGMPIRSNGTFTFKVNDYIKLIDKIAGVKDSYLVDDVKLRITAVLDQLLMNWIVKEGKDMFNLQANSFDIAKGIKTDLDMQIFDTGITITGFNIMSFNYPEEIQEMINKNASHSMIGDMNRYQQASMIDGISSGKVRGGGVASDMAGMMMGMNMANQMMQNMNNNTANPNSGNFNPGTPAGTAKPNFCPNCGQKTGEANFCPNCGQKLA
ncbi:SPFH domain-containing protein [Anaerocolumna aminovalerica]|uniref:Membrane protease subunit, stomatin/prohibitin family, contains C-terminal Zn-ribbon domain n=1 Tax=Anaerocolumna aminovalerica TaxID=1527 RepID=A0A1I5HYN3_9FIRM|nr:SPFH domain-containing protein [Anaerocolumna aminovalerica]MBU5333991.1 SPFH domain-containing protein [Anaerocolumna aminovalerica]SFO53454.1 Membrane protease subunit, stomatin/prohibitin family, contains C-terminal Zn-ribbon domain [Anaerocolumna aminovalerica]